MKIKRKICAGLAALCLIVLVMETAAAAATLRWGSRGESVRQVQQRLQKWGYLAGAADGMYGRETQNAVRLFQEKNGLKVDGIVGQETLTALGLPSGAAENVSASERDAELLARLVYGEARGEPYLGQVAVAAVVLNRVQDAGFPNTISGVIYQAGAFDVVADGQINLTPDAQAIRAAQDALNGWDPTNGCLYYYNPKRATSDWIYTRQVMMVIGQHHFAV